ncbi:MAG TPA: glycosyltransferase [Clostridiales bacterium]|nr:glycosyltransferase [Clostridiales bacterium]
MKVLHIIDMLSAGGKERRLLELLKNLKKNYPEVNNRLIVLNEDIFYDEFKNLGIDIICINRKKVGALKTYSEIKKIFRLLKPEIVHSWGTVPSLYISFLKLKYKFKFINALVASAPENLKFTKTWFYAKFSFFFSDLILSNSSAGLKAFGVSESKGRKIYNGFNNDRLKYCRDKDQVRKELGVRTELAVCMVATFSDKKDYDTYLSAADALTKKRTDVTFLSIGDGRNLTKFKEMYRNNDRMIFTGSRKDVEDIVNSCDIAVLCTYGESLSNSILEYMALGKPAIATDRGGNKEIIENSVSGYLFEHRNIEDFSRRLTLLLDDCDLRIRMGKRSQQIVKEKFSIGGMTKQTYDLYAGMIK